MMATMFGLDANLVLACAWCAAVVVLFFIGAWAFSWWYDSRERAKLRADKTIDLVLWQLDNETKKARRDGWPK